MDNFEQRMMAFAAINHGVKLIQKASREGSLSEDELTGILSPICVISPKDARDVYIDNPNLELGYQTIVQQFGNGETKEVECTRYLVSVLALERKLAAKPQVLAQLAERIERVQQQLIHFSFYDDTILSNLADIYSQLISPLGPKVQVTGNPHMLKMPLVQHQIRAILLSCIRSSVLWRQLGGKRRQLIFNRKQIVDFAKNKTKYYPSN